MTNAGIRIIKGPISDGIERSSAFTDHGIVIESNWHHLSTNYNSIDSGSFLMGLTDAS